MRSRYWTLGSRIYVRMQVFVGAAHNARGASPSKGCLAPSPPYDRQAVSRFRDRLDADYYQDDPVFGIGLGDSTPGDADAIWVPERIMERIVALGRAYELHYLPMVVAGEATYLNATQAEGMEEELAFVVDRVDDPLVHEHGRRIADFVARGAREGAGVTFEGE